MWAAALIPALFSLALIVRVAADGATCEGQAFKWPVQTLCWGLANEVKSYHCMWYTMEQLSGWPDTPRTPKIACDEIDIDCDSSLICSVMLEYHCRGPTDCWGTDQDRQVATNCIRKKCPKEAQAADDSISKGDGHPHGAVPQCPITGYSAKATPRAPTLWKGMRLWHVNWKLPKRLWHVEWKLGKFLTDAPAGVEKALPLAVVHNDEKALEGAARWLLPIGAAAMITFVAAAVMVSRRRTLGSYQRTATTVSIDMFQVQFRQDLAARADSRTISRMAEGPACQHDEPILE